MYKTRGKMPVSPSLILFFSLVSEGVGLGKEIFYNPIQFILPTLWNIQPEETQYRQMNNVGIYL
jgi:hypothetical protein